MAAKLQILLVLIGITLVVGRNVHEMEVSAGTFSWTLCNKTAVPIAVKNLTILPDPIQFGKPLVLTADAFLSADVGVSSTFSADLKVMMKVEGQYYDICNYEPKYCHYEDLCSLISTKLSGNCPGIVQKQWNCKCPLKKNEYSVTKLVIPLPNPKISISGEFDLTIDMNENKKEVGCLNVRFCLGSC